MITLSLDGAWSARDAKRGSQPFPASVPGCVHHDLEQAGLIPDPYVGENELAVQWIGEHDWIYERDFSVDEALLAHDRLLLQCDGLDTLATISINGRTLASTDNMFRRWEFDLAGRLKPGLNRIAIRFASARLYTRAKNQQRHLCTPKCIAHEEPGRGYLRKEQCNFGWDWGPVLVTCGIWQSIRLCAWSQARLDAVQIQQHHQGKRVSLGCTITSERSGQAACSAEIQVGFGEKLVATDCVGLTRGKGVSELTIKQPQLWWPAGHGEQPLYTVTVILRDAGGAELDRWHRRIGLRQLELVREKDQWGQSFTFACNGRSFFAKGANWIPADAIKARLQPTTVRGLLESAVEGNMNMIRVWGGGLYEPDSFYDACDELGLCVWQDFMFACTSFPADDEAFCASIAAEAADQVKRLRHHASLALWCGNNELEQGVAAKGRTADNPASTWPWMPWPLYSKIFDVLLAKVVKTLDPHTPYWPASPHTPVGNRDDHRNPDCGDAHLWDVWHGQQPFEWYRTSFHRFCSEFGFQSFPEPRTVASYALTDDERNITSPVMEFHQRSGIGNSTIMRYMLSWFPMPNGSQSVLWMSQIQQGLAIKYAVEHWRQHMDRCRGALYWQLNDCWPIASWASIDYYGRWKALQYMSKRFFAPLMVSGVEDPDQQQVAVHVSSDRASSSRCELRWRISDTAGMELAQGGKTVQARPDRSAVVERIDCRQAIAQVGQRRVLVWLELWQGGELVSHNLVSFVKPKHMGLEAVRYSQRVEQLAPGHFALTLRCDKPSLWTWFSLTEADARWSDSFACLSPGQDYRFEARCAETLSLAAFKQQLQIASIRDCF